MRIGIITFNRAINYGAVLQSYALKNKIISMGHECEILNYYCEELEKGASPFYVRSLSPKDILIFLLQIRMRLVKNKQFYKFRERYLDVTENVLTAENIGVYTQNFDLLITGSDQVWNYEITGLDKNYFLDFAGQNIRKASYAASFGVSQIPEEYIEQYKRLLSSMDSISVREEAGQNLVEQLISIRPEIVIDPVFLLSKEEWERIIINPAKKKEYILVYSINKSNCYQMAEKLSQEKGMEIVGLQTPMSNRIKCTAIRTESPQEYLGWIYNAKYIVTDSFHGTAFSIIFNKQFLLCKGGTGAKRLSRQETLLKTMGLSKRFCDVSQYQLMFERIDYDTVNRTICLEKEKALTYLTQIME